MRLSAWPITDVGRVRSHNEDSHLVNDEIGLYLVADGMGGHAGGAHASRTCVEVVGKVVERGLQGLSGMPREIAAAAVNDLLGAAASEASARIYDQAQREPSLHGMGTTLTGMLFHEDRAHIVHIGDSRCYMFRSGTARQLTNDHSWLNEQVQAGLLTEEEAAASDLKHIITRSVGFEREVQADLLTVNVSPGDAFLLCSDGMCNYIELDELAHLARQNFQADLPRVCTEVALERGGEDNITVVVIGASNGPDRRRGPRPLRKTIADTLPPQ
ncbi:serine/threonine-protein phosphatase [Pseudenhygromyxa sp. WMMC2535]|uniref:PP2C family protein-serine/threonine phosphatase n=1 Tax=Pseudenhygromyxa sp. WMMC2535 TaxID=2712867 RepID=UPI0015523B87|nr:protein phosphatase 2C domain-containing protein [Pseudenhygromyxa sp. WMMC2535]NVB43277.1 serine/threonine-protein phosphatase [Pseudenhygromyxa sp. WMMC2535]